jgi:hypothetical protein
VSGPSQRRHHLYIQNESPGKDEPQNWPKDNAPAMLDDTWKIPPVKLAH